eukprot:155710-Pelagomonas_calceolata.AAC.4
MRGTCSEGPTPGIPAEQLGKQRKLALFNMTAAPMSAALPAAPVPQHEQLLSAGALVTGSTGFWWKEDCLALQHVLTRAAHALPLLCRRHCVMVPAG